MPRQNLRASPPHHQGRVAEGASGGVPGIDRGGLGISAVLMRHLLRAVRGVELLCHETTERLESLAPVLGGERRPELLRDEWGAECYWRRGGTVWRRGLRMPALLAVCYDRRDTSRRASATPLGIVAVIWRGSTADNFRGSLCGVSVTAIKDRRLRALTRCTATRWRCSTHVHRYGANTFAGVQMAYTSTA